MKCPVCGQGDETTVSHLKDCALLPEWFIEKVTKREIKYLGKHDRATTEWNPKKKYHTWACSCEALSSTAWEEEKWALQGLKRHFKTHLKKHKVWEGKKVWKGTVAVWQTGGLFSTNKTFTYTITPKGES